MAQLEKIQNIVIKVFMVIVYAAMVLIPVSMFCQVIARYFFKHPIAGVEELATACFIWMVIFGSAVLYKERKHIVVDAFISKLDGMPKRIVNIIGEILMMVILITMIYACFQALPFQKMYKTVVLKICTATHTKALIVSLIFMLISSLGTTIRLIIGDQKYV